MTNNPYSVQIEPTWGCNKKCKFCAWTYQEDKTVKFMHPDTARLMAIDLNKWFDGKGKRIELAMIGEPLLNKKLHEIIMNIRDNYPKCQITLTTNGDLLRRNNHSYDLKYDKITSYFNDGINRLLIDTYDGHDQLMNYYNQLCNYDIPVWDYYKKIDEGEIFPVYGYKNNHHKMIILMDNLGSQSGRHVIRTAWNYAGNIKKPVKFGKHMVTIPKEPPKKNCTRIYRELIIRHDGAVGLCCLDASRELVLGKFPENSLHDIWFSRPFEIVRKFLAERKRVFMPCSVCDYWGGGRQGLIYKQKPDFGDMTEDALLEELDNFYGKYSNMIRFPKIRNKVVQTKLEV
ncbi:SPASM domain-containing protein [candidate division WOR-3 bacterium]|nr:SPASM domain-containing protein [candidate division WOR-3 bacterium]